MSLASREVNKNCINNIYNRTLKILYDVGKNLSDCKVFILGFAFKGEPETSDLRDSTTLLLSNNYKKIKLQIYGDMTHRWDKDLEKFLIKPASLEQGFYSADAVYLMNNHRIYSSLNINKFISTMNHPSLFYDGWHIFEPSNIRKIPGVIYAGVGVG